MAKNPFNVRDCHIGKSVLDYRNVTLLVQILIINVSTILGAGKACEIVIHCHCYHYWMC